MEIETFASKTTDSEPCSVIQGSKFSGTLYNLYNIDVPALHEIMKDRTTYQKMVGKTIPCYKMVRHITIQYVDDSTSVVSCNDFEVLRKYLQDYYDLLVIHYKNNKLVLNGEKTAIMLL